MKPEDDTRNCFVNALKDEQKGKKHKGLLKTNIGTTEAKEYIDKAQLSIEMCTLYKDKGFDFKLPEEWFYALYYCGLAILAKFGVESRSQRCTALFLRYIKDEGLIDYDDDFIKRITVHRNKDEKSDVDEREEARYGPSVKIDNVSKNYDKMINICKEALSQCKEIVFSEKEFKLPPELQP